MKKFMKSIQMMAALLLAVAATTACSKEDNAIDEQTPATTGAPKTYTLTVTASKGGEATTRALSIDDTGALNATWTKGETVSVYSVTGEGITEAESLNPVGTLTAQGSGATTTLTGTFDEGYTPTFGAKLRLKVNEKPDYKTQDGTLEYIAANCDYAVADVTITKVNGDEVNGYEVKTTAATFVNQQAIVKFSLMRPNGKTPLAAKSMKVTYGSSTYNVTLDTPASDIFVAIPGKSKKTVTLSVTSDDGNFDYETSDITFENGKYYAIGVKMPALNLSTVTSDYTAQDGDVLTGKLGGAEASNTRNVKIAAGATVTLRDVDITNVADDNGNQMAGIECLGDATIILSGSNKVRSGHYNKPAILVHSDYKLTIKGNGALEATATGNGAGIGGGKEDNCGDIEILSGDITAKGDAFSAGIGSGDGHSCGTITITGGTVTATGGKGAGIGSGVEGSCTGITITGGTVTATGGFGAGIGSGDTGSCTGITIKGGNVTATGGLGAGIGSGTGGSCTGITITGGTVKATGGHGAGIGSGDSGNCGDITITDGVSSVTASNGSADCSIGRGYNGSCDKVTIGGTVYYDGTNFWYGGETYLANSPLVYEP